LFSLKTTCNAFLIILICWLSLAGADKKTQTVDFPTIKDKDVKSTYVLGPDDQISVRALHLDEISEKPAQIDATGAVNLPLIGRIQASGLTVEQLEGKLTERLKVYLNNPQVSVNILEFRSQPVSVIGAVNNPGVVQLRGHKSLVEVVSLAGGLRADAGYRIQITRKAEWGTLPLPGVKVQEDYSVGEVSVKTVLEAKNPSQNIAIKPYDIISVPVGEMVYVTGDVRRSGGFVLHEKESISVLQAMALAEGSGPAAALGSAKILRARADSADRTEIAVDIRAILKGKASDVRLESNDILFIPSSFLKKASVRTIEAGINVGSGIAVWRF
jgi:polysaccharide export outer membrane protein